MGFFSYQLDMIVWQSESFTGSLFSDKLKRAELVSNMYRFFGGGYVGFEPQYTVPADIH